MPDLQSLVRPRMGRDTPQSRELTFELDLFPDRLSQRYRSGSPEKTEGCPIRRGSPEDYCPSHGSGRAQNYAPGPCPETSSPMPPLRGKPSKRWVSPPRCSHTRTKLLSTKAPEFDFWVGTGSARKLWCRPLANSSTRARTLCDLQDEFAPTKAQHPA